MKFQLNKSQVQVNMMDNLLRLIHPFQVVILEKVTMEGKIGNFSRIVITPLQVNTMFKGTYSKMVVQ